MNNNNGNGNGVKLEPEHNGKGLNHLLSHTPEIGESSVSPLPSPKPRASESKGITKFEQPVILQQSPIWSRAILWSLMSVATIAIVWASVAKIEEAIPATGKLEPQGTVKEVQAPVAGVVKAIYVDDGQRVHKGDRLLALDSTLAKSQNASLQKIRTSLLQENQFYTAIMRPAPNTASRNPAIRSLKLPPQLVSLTESRSALVAENQLLRAQLSGVTKGVHLNPEQIERLQSNKAELNYRVAAALLEAEQLKAQLNQTAIQLDSAKTTLSMNQGILKNVIPLAQNGAISQIQLLKQQQEVEQVQAQVAQLTQEQTRLVLAINQANFQVQNNLALDRQTWLNQMAENALRIAEIDSQLTKAIVKNNKRLAEVDSQISQAQLSLRYEELTAPSSGTVFDMQANTPGFVANASQPILKIVPDDALTAKVFITNRDIGFVKEGMNVDVRIDSFPYSEFGDIKGKLVWIGSDALPPDQIHPFYRFPAKVRLERQSLLINGRAVPLQSGMSVNANIKVRDRTVMSIFTDLFTNSVESLKEVR